MCMYRECAYILLDGSCQPLGSFTINVPGMTGEATNRGVRSGPSSVSMPKCDTNPFPKPKLHECANSLLSARSLSQKPEQVEFGESSTPSGPASKPVLKHTRQPSGYPSPLASSDLHRHLSWKLQSPPPDLECTWNTSSVFSPLNFPNCLPLQKASKACQSDADDKNYLSRAPLPLPELMWSI